MELFPIDQIKSGYLLVIRDCLFNEVYYAVVNYNRHDALGYYGDKIYDSINSLDANLEIKAGNKVLYRVEAIYGRAYNCKLMSCDVDDRRLIWKRELDAKKLTVSEIEKFLGYPVEIIAEGAEKPE